MIDELRHVRGITPQIYARAAQHITLIGDGDLNVNAAPKEVLLAIPGINEATVTELLRLRESGILPRSDDQLAGLIPGARSAIEAEGRAFTRRTTYTTDQVEILVEGWVDGGLVRVNSRVVVSRSNSGARVVWRETF